MNGETPPPAGDPLVTIFVASYNQENFIAAAVEGAFAQTYPNLEIILSDDGSRDRTFDIIKEMAAAYDGPHKVIVNQTPENRGLLAHLYEIAGLSSGALIVAAAGDDVSHPDRVERTVREWQRNGAPVLFSSWNVIDTDGTFIEKHNVAENPSSVRKKTLQEYFRDPKLIKFHGALAAYSREVFEKIALPDAFILEEDYFLTLMLTYLGGRIHYFEEQLVSYRRSNDSLSHHAEDIDFGHYEQKAQRLSRSRAEILRHFATKVYETEHPRFSDRPAPDVDIKRLRRDIAYYEYRANWLKTPLTRRLLVLTRLDSFEELRWALPRVLGAPVLFAFKSLKRRIYKRIPLKQTQGS